MYVRSPARFNRIRVLARTRCDGFPPELPRALAMTHPALLSASLAAVLLCLGASSPAHAAKPSGRDHWAFRAIRRPKVPEVANRTWVRNPIDHFVLARLEK